MLAGLAWPNHVDFLRDTRGWRKVRDEATETVRAHAGHPALAGWLVGNEIETSLARFLGASRVTLAMEDLIDAVRPADPGALFAYANYPSTEYLNPRNADFLAMNLYLEDRDAFVRYAARLQNLAGDRPAIVTEFGVDSQAHGEEVQASILRWHVAECRRAGLAGTVVFSFTDAWWRGGEDVHGWSFGLTSAERSPKAASVAIAEEFSQPWQWEPDGCPSVSVVVCTFNGSRTLESCLESLTKLDYPRFELLVIDDGSTDGSPEIARSFPAVRLVTMPHGGLSAARNRGAREATGDLIAYTDDDCLVDPDWLAYVAAAFSDPEVVAAGGPNIPPKPRNLAEACVGAAPGGPAAVLLDDTTAEHVPGCNLVVRKSALEAIGGFREAYVAAGDDVDFCWRLQEAGGRIAYAPAAMVWHHRRASVGDYVKQQRGYGRAEALLMRDHPKRFGKVGGARWEGTVYAGSPASAATGGARIYFGGQGLAPFQLIYGGQPYSALDLASGARWVAFWVPLTLVLVAVAPAWAPVPAVMLGLTLFLAWKRAGQARPVDGGLRSRWILFCLNLVAPLVRGGARWLGAWRLGARPEGKGGKWWNAFPAGSAKVPSREYAFWSEEGVGREALLAELSADIAWGDALVPGWDDTDLAPNKEQCRFRIVTATEYHGGKKMLTRVRCFRKESIGLPLYSVILLALGGVFYFNGIVVGYLPIVLAWGASPLFVWFADGGFRHGVLAAAERIGLKRIRP